MKLEDPWNSLLVAIGLWKHSIFYRLAIPWVISSSLDNEDMAPYPTE